MSFLEALARGQVVIGANQSTYTDYVTHEVNGLVSDFHKPLPNYSDNQLQAMSRRALESVQEGYERWLSNQERLVEICTNPRHQTETGTESSFHMAHIKQRLIG